MRQPYRKSNPATRLGQIILVGLFLLASCSRLPIAPTNPGEATKTQTPAASSTTTPTPSPTAIPKPTRTPKPTLTPTPVFRNVLTIHLKTGLHWSDGTELIARDLVGTYNILWAQKNGIWSSIYDVSARDDHTIDFKLSKASPLVLYQLLRSSPIAPYSQYGDWMDQAGDARKAGYTPDSPEVKKVVDELTAFKPATVVVSGPFVFDPNRIGPTKLELVKHPGGYNSDRIDFDRIVVNYTKAADSTTMVLFNKIDYSSYPYPSSEIDRLKSMGNIQVLRLPTGSGPGLWFNEAVSPLDKKEVRQAFAYMIDRNQNAKAAVGEAGQATKYLTGLTDTQIAIWLAPVALSGLNLYQKDLSRAEQLLKSAGCQRNAQGKWVDDQGKPMSYELLAPAEKADWLKAAEDVASQFTGFGIQTTVKTYPLADRLAVQKAGKYQLLVDLGDYYSPMYPAPSFSYFLSTPRNNPEATDNQYGLKWPWKQVGADGQEYDVTKLLKSASDGFDSQSQAPAMQTLASIVNDQLPILPLFESYTIAPINIGARVDGWLAADDPIYRNNQQQDDPVAIQLLDGALKKSAKGDGFFATVAAYPRSYPYDLNYFSRNSLFQKAGAFSYNLMYPPLFWQRWADGSYLPALAQSFEIK